ncbi:MAG: manganese efflux pump [Desulfobulbaceae bacterium]|nr:manganese efflux pump [Desulfobulbaceae bacterium]
MDLTTIFVIAIALAVDAFAVALAAGISLPWVGRRHTFRLAWHFGLFQAGMNIIGWGAGLTIRTYIERYDHWLAFGLLAFVGGRMIIETLQLEKEDEKDRRDPTRGRTLVILSLATSIDSLAVGLSFAVLKISVWFPALVIGIVASVLTAAGLHLGQVVGSASRLGAKVEVAGGLVLIAIGIRILHDHGVF